MCVLFIGCTTKDDAETYSNQGAAYAAKGQHDRAISEFNKALEINPQHAEIYYNRGMVYRAKEQYDQAISDYNKAIEINDTDFEAIKGLGVVYMLRALDKDNKDEQLKAEPKEKALRQWRLSLELKPDQRNREGLLKLIEKYSKQQ